MTSWPGQRDSPEFRWTLSNGKPVFGFKPNPTLVWFTKPDEILAVFLCSLSRLSHQALVSACGRSLSGAGALPVRSVVWEGWFGSLNTCCSGVRTHPGRMCQPNLIPGCSTTEIILWIKVSSFSAPCTEAASESMNRSYSYIWFNVVAILFSSCAILSVSRSSLILPCWLCPVTRFPVTDTATRLVLFGGHTHAVMRNSISD